MNYRAAWEQKYVSPMYALAGMHACKHSRNIHTRIMFKPSIVRIGRLQVRWMIQHDQCVAFINHSTCKEQKPRTNNDYIKLD